MGERWQRFAALRRERGTRRLGTSVLVAAMLLLPPGCAVGEEPPSGFPVVDGIRGRVTRAFDGDSFVMRSEGRKIEVRVFGIDAPEKGQPWSRKSRARSKDLLEDEEVIVRVTTPSDRYGRVVGEVFLPDGRSYAHVIVREGLAWQFRRYSKDTTVAALEREARRQRRGLWADANPEPPWEYRRRKPRR